MSKMSELHADMQLIRSLEPVMSAEDDIGYRLDCMLRELEEIRLMAGNPETAILIEANFAGVAQVYACCKSIALNLAAQRRRAA